MVVAHTHAKDQGQRSLGSKVRVEKDGRTDGRMKATALHLVLMRLVTMQIQYNSTLVRTEVNTDDRERMVQRRVDRTGPVL